MYTNEFAPPLFREIFKNSFLPFKDPSTLNMFLKEINEFHYSHSEKLGDAYEYLLSYMGSQGDAGQFRTPRHIIDFIVEIVDPKKNERILDPACGTAGFLISSYKHIMKPGGKKLTALERKKLSNNLVGYDISPDMTRISLVNMYLHNFTSPQIWEYDTLSSEDKWNEYYDVILANPPFFSPKGGIQPHSRFGVDSKRAEVLFVDYIMSHLKSNGRAGVIVPEGIIFQVGRAYKALRKRLVEEFLVGVISLPAGVFQPYSGVKTSILILDKEISRNSKEIFFASIESDGFDLGAQRRKLDHNDLPDVLKQINLFKIGKNSSLFTIRKDEIEKSDFTLSKMRYSSKLEVNSSFKVVPLTEYVLFQKGTSITKKQTTPGDFPVIAGGKKPAYSHNVYNRKKNSITIASSGTAGYVDFHEKPIFASDCFTIESNSKQLEQKFLYYLLKFKQEHIYSFKLGGVQPHVYEKSFYSFQIPLPTIEIQKEVVRELDGYQKIIDGARQVVENYKPYIDIDLKWKLVFLSEISLLTMGQSPDSKFYNSSGEGLEFHQGKKQFTDRYIGVSGVWASQYKRTANPNTIVMSVRAPVGDVNLTDRKVALGRGLCSIAPTNKCDAMYLYYILHNSKDALTDQSHGSAFASINRNQLEQFKIPFPSIETQRSIVSHLEKEYDVVTGNRELIEIYAKKIHNRIAKVWGE